MHVHDPAEIMKTDLSIIFYHIKLCIPGFLDFIPPY